MLRAFVPLEHLLLLLLLWRGRVLTVHHLRPFPCHHDLPLELLLKLRLSSVHNHITAHHLRLLLLVAQKMLTHASRSSWENSGTKVSGNPSAIWELSPEGLRESTWHRRLKRTTSLGPALGDDTVWEEHEVVTTMVVAEVVTTLRILFIVYTLEIHQENFAYENQSVSQNDQNQTSRKDAVLDSPLCWRASCSMRGVSESRDIPGMMQPGEEPR